MSAKRVRPVPFPEALTWPDGFAPDAVDLFAGPGGWDVAAHELGLTSTGFENDPWACHTRRAAGFVTVHGDVRVHDPLDAVWRAWLLIASPPCQTFSAAGKGEGRKAMADVLTGIASLVAGEPLPHFEDERTGLVLEPLRWILARHRAGVPFEWVVLEQVPGVLPVWREYLAALEPFGYRGEARILSAEEYGVPQTRERAILIARLGGTALLPYPTHTPYKKGTPRDVGMLGMLPWVSMAEALNRGMTERPSLTVTGGGTGSGGGAETFGNAARATMGRELEAGRWAEGDVRFAGAGATSQKTSGQIPRNLDEPAHTVTGGGSAAWVGDETVETGQNSRQAGGTSIRYERSTSAPAPTITGQTRSWRVRSNYGTHGDPEVRGERSQDEPAATITGKAGRNQWVPEDGGPVEGEGPQWGYVGGNQDKATRRDADEPAPTVCFGNDAAGVRWEYVGGNQEHATRRDLDEPAPTVHFAERCNAVEWVPEFADQSGTDFDHEWPSKRPSTVVAGRGLVQNPGATANRFNGSTKSRNDGVRVSVVEAAVLQTFPADYPWQGPKGERYQQVGNAVPPLLALAVLSQVRRSSDG